MHKSIGFVRFLRERRRLEARIEALENNLRFCRGMLDLQRMERDRHPPALPEHVRELIEDANEILQRVHKGQRTPVWPIRNWRINYILWKRESE